MKEYIEYGYELMRKNPLDYLNDDIWQVNFCLLNLNLQIFGRKINPESGSTDLSIADWLTYNDVDCATWFVENMDNREIFLPVSE